MDDSTNQFVSQLFFLSLFFFVNILSTARNSSQQVLVFLDVEWCLGFLGLKSNCNEILDCTKILVSDSLGIQQPLCKILHLKYELMRHEKLANIGIFKTVTRKEKKNKLQLLLTRNDAELKTLRITAVPLHDLRD